MKIPNWKELNFDITKELWSLKPKTYKEWKAAKSNEFCKHLGYYLISNNKHNKSNFTFLYKVLFLYSFTNYKKELELLNKFKANGFDCYKPERFKDSILGIDLIATKGQDSKFAIQVKTRANRPLLKHIKTYSINNGYVPVLAIKNNKSWKLYNLLNSKIILI